MRRRTYLKASAVGGLWLLTTACGDDTPGRSRDAGADGRRDRRRAATVPSPAAMIRTSWSTDPWALGSYSYLGVGAEPALRRALRRPVRHRLFLAGEATSSEHPATVHGALSSGERVAEEVRDAAADGDRVLVVGAGIAGLTAADLLAGEDVDVAVWEARDRVGGRLATIRPDGWPIPVELGASWVHDTAASDLARRLEDLDVGAVAFDYEHAAVGGDGRPVEDVEVLAGPAAETLDLAVGWAGEQDEDRSLARAIEQSGAAEDTAVDPEVLAWYLASELTTEYGASAEELSAWWGLEEGSEGDDLIVVGGYATLAEDLADGLEVHLGRSASAVEIGDDDVRVTDGDGRQERFERVVLTVPLGVLKAGTITFDPPLPPATAAAVSGLGMGLLDKFWFRFEEPFWSGDALMWSRVAPVDQPFSEWFNLVPATGEPVLLALLGGPEARTWAERGDADVEAAALASLQGFLDAGL